MLLKCDTAIIYPAYCINTNLFICHFYISNQNLYGIYISGIVAQPQISICEITAFWLATFEVAALSRQCGFLATRYRIDHQAPDFDDRIACDTTPAHLTSAECTSLHGIGPADMARSRCWASALNARRFVTCSIWQFDRAVGRAEPAAYREKPSLRELASRERCRDRRR